MELPKGVEWAAHALLVLHVVGEDRPLSSAGLARLFDLSPTYLNKHLQKLATAGMVTSARGANGGFRLDRDAEQITLHDVVTALDGTRTLFRCNEIRCQGVFADQREVILARGLCGINRAMGQAEDAWRSSLRDVSIAALAANMNAAARTRIIEATSPKPTLTENQ
ncbi:RrF2 family transcriptional regulator [Williamsia sterculiae]|uniref:Transcriptional regulator, BadM/Rrf2 family n=1 Tax=Williamsia sterculiae TaxID=1344003 RepID=A0A1N7H668_9NOCA|nr:Rrf2 family transcriptional regulator [Williamsia sterculiae]SIS20374.1 transcriptional regulator, BadM/Rrf2 family [Williamsia sterculiae]